MKSYHLVKNKNESSAVKCLISNTCNIYTKILRTRLMRKYNKLHVVLFIFLWHTAQESILDKLIMTELMWKSTLICAALEDQFVKSEVYKPNCKSLPVKSSEKVFMFCIWIWENELSLPSFINHRNDMVTKQSFLPNFQAWFLVFHNAAFSN